MTWRPDHRGWAWPAAAGPIAAGAAALAACTVLAVVDPNEPGHYPTCPFKAVTGLDCPGCGSMRAVHALTRGDIVRAADLNIVLVALIPLALWSWVGWLARALGSRPVPRGLPEWGIRAIPVALVAFWVLRNVPVAPLSALGA